jgi:hypothetical protein
MLVACFCGYEFKSEADLGECPRCGELATIPRVSTAHADQMRGELELLVAGQADD